MAQQLAISTYRDGNRVVLKDSTGTVLVFVGEFDGETERVEIHFELSGVRNHSVVFTQEYGPRMDLYCDVKSISEAIPRLCSLAKSPSLQKELSYTNTRFRYDGFGVCDVPFGVRLKGCSQADTIPERVEETMFEVTLQMPVVVDVEGKVRMNEPFVIDGPYDKPLTIGVGVFCSGATIQNWLAHVRAVFYDPFE